jgi:hypothetical protein
MTSQTTSLEIPRLANKDETEIFKIFGEVVRHVFAANVALLATAGVIFRISPRYQGLSIWGLAINRFAEVRVDYFLLVISFVATFCVFILGHRLYSSAFAGIVNKMTVLDRETAIEEIRSTSYSSFSVSSAVCMILWLVTILFKVLSSTE